MFAVDMTLLMADHQCHRAEGIGAAGGTGVVISARWSKHEYLALSDLAFLVGRWEGPIRSAVRSWR